MEKGVRFGSTLCPHCQSTARQRSSRPLSDLTREKKYVCTNYYCGYVFISLEEIQRTVVPSHMPRAGINLPMSKVAERLHGHLKKNAAV